MSTTFENLEQVEQSLEKGEAEREERHEELTQQEREKEQLLDALLGDTFHIRVGAKRMKCTPIDGKEDDSIEDMMFEFIGIEDEEDLTKEQRDKYLDGREQMVEMLAEHTVDDKWDYDFWKRAPKHVRQEAMRDIREGGEEANRAGN